MQDETTSTRSQSNKSNGKWKSAAQSVASDVKESEVPNQIMDSAKQAYDTVVEKASDVFSGMNANPTTYIRQYPIQAALGGLAVGFLLGAAVSRRSVAK